MSPILISNGISSPPLRMNSWFTQTCDRSLDGKSRWHAPGKDPSSCVRPVSQQRKGTRYGWALDLGELAMPLRTWEEVLSHVGEGAAQADRLVKQVKSAIVLLRYQRGSHEGVVALRAQWKDGKVRLESIESASKSSRTLRLRAGYDASDLSRFTVAIVGIGAIGSLLADQLCRCGIGKLLLVDSERLRPGNTIRHLVDLDSVGQYKTAAVARHLQVVGLSPSTGLVSRKLALSTPDQATHLFEAADLVVDATGSPTTSALLIGGADIHQKPLLVTYLQRDGDVVRLERYPLGEGEDQEPPVPPGTVLRDVVRESGCGDPISPAPPSSASVAAGLASLAAADLLLGRDVPPALTHVLRPQPDQPYRQRSVRPVILRGLSSRFRSSPTRLVAHPSVVQQIRTSRRKVTPQRDRRNPYRIQERDGNCGDNRDRSSRSQCDREPVQPKPTGGSTTL